MRTVKQTKGFTLIELLIVIAIIGILSTVVMSALNSARYKARNIQRVAQLHQIKRALESYYDDFGHYPVHAGFQGDCQWTHVETANVVPGLVPTYIPTINPDPTHIYTTSPVVNQSCLAYQSNGTDYALVLFNIVDPSPGHATFDYDSQPAWKDPHRDSVSTAGDCNIDSNTYGWKIYTQGACDW